MWAWIAPPIHSVIALTKSGDRVHAYLGNESDNFFVAAFLLVGLVVALAVVSAVLVWQWRAASRSGDGRRAGVGSAVAAGAAAGVGALLVRSRYDVDRHRRRADLARASGALLTEAPPVFFAHSPLLIAASIMFPAAMAALVYALIAVSTSRDDLGGWPPVDQPRDAAAGHSGRRSTVRPVTTFAAMRASRAMPT